MIHRLAHLFNLYRGRVISFQVNCCWHIGFQCSKCKLIDGVQTHPMSNPKIMGMAGTEKKPCSAA